MKSGTLITASSLFYLLYYERIFKLPQKGFVGQVRTFLQHADTPGGRCSSSSVPFALFLFPPQVRQVEVFSLRKHQIKSTNTQTGTSETTDQICTVLQRHPQDKPCNRAQTTLLPRQQGPGSHVSESGCWGNWETSKDLDQ